LNHHKGGEPHAYDQSDHTHNRSDPRHSRRERNVQAACGGGGGGGSSETTDPNLAFQVFPSSFFAPSYSESYTLTGSDTDGNDYTATASLKTGAQTTFQGEAAIPVEFLFRFTNAATQASIIANFTNYFSPSSHSRFIGSFSITDGTTGLPSAQMTLPTTARVGDFGSIGTIAYDDGTTEVLSWELHSTSNASRANLILSSVYKDAFGDTTGTEDDTYEIDANGVRHRLTVRYTDADRTINLAGDGR